MDTTKAIEIVKDMRERLSKFASIDSKSIEALEMAEDALKNYVKEDIKTISVKIVSRLNADGYIVNNKFFYPDKIIKLKEYVGNNKVIFEKGRNTFAGTEVSDTFFDFMKKRYYED